MISPSPTQPPSSPQVPERAQLKSTPIRRRTGETPVALFVKAILRPIFKIFYYVIRGIRTHKLYTLLAIIFLIVGISTTMKIATGEFPFGIGSDPFNFQTNGGDGGGDHVKNWLYALRDGNATQMALIEQELTMTQPPDPNTLISQFSQPQGHVGWKSINVIGSYNESDTTTDSFVEVDISSHGPGGSVTGIMLWHFTTISGRILTIELVGGGPRAPLQ
ncbi:MAG: hypothetical protein JO215_03100 [Ktedonobacteraceae bacterium]|nr:hypothetical protein [Ktedonobacteraceae bacterium]MBV9616794.1 hypothetical protein [Ktedonobacteraceae bacterium]MBV9711737.1 hypothetical protein [Ktedonobacteraceae bacterium]